jgi:hypothetical protein
MLRLIFGFWLLSNVRTKEQKRKDTIKQICMSLLFFSIYGWFSINLPTFTMSAPKADPSYVTDDGHTIVYDHKQGKYTSDY